MATSDYGLSAADLEIYGKAGQTVRPRATMGDALGSIGTGIQEKVEEIKEEKQLEQDTLDEGEIQWDAGFDAMGDRGSWASPGMYDDFHVMESGFKDEYLQAIQSGDKKAAAKALQEQGKRSTALQGWVETMGTAKEINDGVGWGASMDRRPEDKALLEALAKNDGRAKMRMGPNGEMMFDVQMPSGETRTVSRREVDKLVAKGTSPKELELAILEKNAALVKSGQNGDLFDENNSTRINRLSIQNDQIPALFNENIGGEGTFRDHIKDHPDFKDKIPVFMGEMMMEGPFFDEDINGDGVIDLNDLTPEEMDMVLDEMENNPDVAKDYISEWMTKTQKNNWQKGADEKVRLDKVRLAEIAANKGDSRTAAERAYDLNQKINKEAEDLAPTDIVLTGFGGDDGNGINVGNMNRYMVKNEELSHKVNGEWYPVSHKTHGLKIIVDNPGLENQLKREIKKRTPNVNMG